MTRASSTPSASDSPPCGNDQKHGGALTCAHNTPNAHHDYRPAPVQSRGYSQFYCIAPPVSRACVPFCRARPPFLTPLRPFASERQEARQSPLTEPQVLAYFSASQLWDAIYDAGRSFRRGQFSLGKPKSSRMHKPSAWAAHRPQLPQNVWSAVSGTTARCPTPCQAQTDTSRHRYPSRSVLSPLLQTPGCWEAEGPWPPNRPCGQNATFSGRGLCVR
jgi:hypothetical protein